MHSSTSPLEATASQAPDSAVPPLTERFARFASEAAFGGLDEVTRETARNCLIDWLAVVVAGNGDPSLMPLHALMREAGGREEASLFGLADRLPAHVAALVNGTASEVHDYDDTYYPMYGHPSAAPIAAAMALAEKAGVAGADLLAAVAVGSELSCRLGKIVGYEPYLRGLSPTGTSGAVAAAGAGARVLGLDVEQTRRALSVGAGQAAGLHANGSSAAMQLQAGRAGGAAVMAAELVLRGFAAHGNVLEAPRGFVSSRGGKPDWDAGLDGLGTRFAIRDMYFKFHASCGGTQATIAATEALRSVDGVTPERVDAVDVRISQTVKTLCRVSIPTNGYDGKFSLAFCVAATLLGIDLGRLETFDMVFIDRPDVQDLMARVTVTVDESLTEWEAVVAIRTHDAATLIRRSAIGEDDNSPTEIAARVRNKFLQLASPALGGEAARHVLEVIGNLEVRPSADLFAALSLPRG